MINLFLTVCLTSLIYLIFRGFVHFKVQTFQAIAVNYVICVITGIAFSGFSDVVKEFYLLPTLYFFLPFCLAISFLLGFNLIAYSSQKISVSLSTVASRLSLILPILFSLFFFNSETKRYGFLNIVGIILVFGAILLISIPSNKESRKIQKKHLWLLPMLFLLTGFIDTLLTLANQLYNEKGVYGSLALLTFGFAAVFALILSLIYKKSFKVRDVIGGIVLGVPNYFSVYFLTEALSSFGHDSTFVFTINNLSVIILTSVMSITLLNEKLSKVNLLGLVVSIFSLFFVIL